MKKVLQKSPNPIALFIALALSPAPLWAACTGLGTSNSITCTGTGPSADSGNFAGSHAGAVNVDASSWELDNGNIFIDTDDTGTSFFPDGDIEFVGTGVTVTNGNANGNGDGMIHASSGDAQLVSVKVNDSNLTSSIAGTGGVVARVASSGNSEIALSNTIVSVVDSIGAHASVQDGNATILLSNQAKVTVTNSGALASGHGILSAAHGLGSAIVVTDVGTEITTVGDNLSAIGLSSLNSSASNSDVVYAGTNSTITTSGNNSHGIDAISGNDVSVDIINSGNISTQGHSALGIKAVSAAGMVLISNSGDIKTQGNNSTAIIAETTAISSGHLYVASNGKIETQDAQAILAKALNGNVYIDAANDISTGQVTATTNSHGIEAATRSDGEAIIAYSSGTLTVKGNDSGGGSSIGILAWDQGSGAADVDGGITLHSNAVVDASLGVTGLQMQVSGKGYIDIRAGSKVYGGSHAAISFVSTGSNAALHQLDNAGEIVSMNDRAIVSDVAGAGSSTVINNSGTITGYLNFNGSDVTFNNFSANSWNLRNFADTNGDGVRDTKGVAISDFGSGTAVYTNEAFGALRLSAVTDDTLPADTTGQYLPVGALSISNAGIVQGQLLNLNRFDNQGLIDLSDNGLAGDVLVISGGSTAGTYGGNLFISNGGQISLDTVLNEGGASSITDMLVLDDVITGAGGATNIYVNHVGGTGSSTVGDGIKIIDVLGTSSADSFRLGRIVKTGIYEYTLHQGSLTTPGDESWYLRNRGNTQLNPDIGSYLGNQTAATTLFMHSMHDRLGEPQYTERYMSEYRIPSIWIRAVAGHSKNRAVGDAFQQHNESYLIHMGGDVAQWTNNGQDRYHLGLMGAYGHNETKTQSLLTDSRVKGSIEGYSAGAYFTWYGNRHSPEGWYADVWSMYSWFDNKAESIDKYRSKVWTSSFELGYAVKFADQNRWQWMVEPHGQAAYIHYSALDKIDFNGMRITDDNANGFITRLGGRVYIKDRYNKMNAQPFIEANWIYASAKNSLKFDDVKMSDASPKNRFETKIGVQGAVTEHVQIYSHIGLQWGKKQYEKSEGQIGLKVRF